MPGGGGGSQTVTQTNLPAYAKPYFLDMMDRANKLSKQKYEPYKGKRIADFTSFQNRGFNSIANLNPVNDVMKAARKNLSQVADYQTAKWDGAAADRYMSPYMEKVLDRQKASAIKEFDRQRGQRDARAVAASAYGGSRAAIQEAVAKEGLADQLADLDAQGRQSAWEQAQSMFTSDEGRALQGQQTKLGAAQGQMSLGEQIFGQNRQQALDMIQAGNQKQQQKQRELDLRYSDFENQRDYERQKLAWYNSILRGVPISNNSNVSQYGPSSNPMTQMMGLGLGGLGMMGSQR